jgi:hypothetical protein
MVVRLGTRGQQVYVELKAWNLDAKLSDFVRLKKLTELAEQASRYVNQSADVVYSFEQKATSPEGIELQKQILQTLSQAGVRFVTFGKDGLVEVVEKLIK